MVWLGTQGTVDGFPECDDERAMTWVEPAAVDRLCLLGGRRRVGLALLPTPIHPLARLTAELGGPEIWIKRDDLTGLAGGGNKTRKLEFLIGDALECSADMLVTVGAVQSNHTRQTAAAAAKLGLGCALLHNAWAPAPGQESQSVGNILLSHLLGAQLYVDEAARHIDDQGRLEELAERLRRDGRRPYVIPGGGSDHRLGGLGYVACAAEIAAQANELGVGFDYVVHCTGSSGTQAGLIAGFAALEASARVIGVADDNETTQKHQRVLRLATATLDELDLPATVADADVRVIAADPNPYGIASSETIDALHLFARLEGLIADPVYEGKAVRGLIDLVARGELVRGDRVLLLHLGGTPAIHAYANHLWRDGIVAL
jgi:1-aminocyclopropane-1-carboxylate deaminase